MDILQAAFAIVGHRHAEVAFHRLPPSARDIGDLDVALEQGGLELDAQHDVEVISELIRLRADEPGLHGVHRKVEGIRLDAVETAEHLLYPTEMRTPEIAAAADVIFLQARLGFMRAEARSAAGVKADEIGRQSACG